MGAKLEIEIVDAGVAPIGAPPPPGAGSPVSAPPAASAPAESSTGTALTVSRNTQNASRDDAGRRLTTVTEGAKVLANALGQGGLLNVTLLLHRAFSELSAAVQGATAAQGGRSVSVPPPPEATGDISKAPDIVHRGILPPPPERSIMDAPDIVPTAAPATEAVGEAASMASAAGPAVLALGAFAAGVGLATAAVSSFMSSMKAEAEKLSAYSPELAGATAMSEVRETLAEMRRADQNGPQLAKFEAERSKLETKMYDVMTKIQGAVLEAVVPAMQVITALPQIIPAAAEVTVDRLTVLADQLIGLFADMKAQAAADAKELSKAQKRLEDIMDAAMNREDDDEVGADPFLQDFMGMDNGAGQLFGPQLPGRRGRMAPGV